MRYKPVQLNPETHAELKQQAKDEHRSMAAHVAHLLEQNRKFREKMARENAEFLRCQHEEADND